MSLGYQREFVDHSILADPKWVCWTWFLRWQKLGGA